MMRLINPRRTVCTKSLIIYKQCCLTIWLQIHNNTFAISFLT